MSRFGLSAKQFYDLTPLEFYEALKDYAAQEKTKGQIHYEAARFICVSVWNSSGKKLRQPIRDVKDFMPFPWEKTKVQDWTEMMAAMREVATKQNKKLENKN